MSVESLSLQEGRERLLESLAKMREFRRGSISTIYRRCGKKRCICARGEHPGHGPLTVLTFKNPVKTKTLSLRTRAAVELAREQIRCHDEFLQWCREWRDLNEKISDMKLNDALRGAAA